MEIDDKVLSEKLKEKSPLTSVLKEALYDELYLSTKFDKKNSYEIR